MPNLAIWGTVNACCLVDIRTCRLSIRSRVEGSGFADRHGAQNLAAGGWQMSRIFV